MLFNSYIFIFVFLPITLIGFFTIGKRGHHRIAISWLVGSSFFFYGWWNPDYLMLILVSILFNYAAGVVLSNHDNKISRQGFLAVSVSANLGILGYYKYSNFFVDELNQAIGTSFHLETVILPLAISFFTFQQIAYLVDAYRGETREYNFLHYCLFVTFFPQLIAGPIVHHKEMLPQFASDLLYRLNYKHLAIGITIFSIGLFKKVIIADSVSEYATPIFSAADQGVNLTIFEAWGGALAYTFQLYFDFSGYSDMAIGLARMFGILLPLNFNSPYKASNIIEFWRRWHITLSRFLRDYLYIPLGGSRVGKMRRYINLMITMLLGGLWHGAGWTFVIWGLLHGLYLVINQAWHAIRKSIGHDLKTSSWIGRGTARIITFVAVVVGWVFFRAESFNGAVSILSAMAGGNGIALPENFVGKLGAIEPVLAAIGISFDGSLVISLNDWLYGIPIIIFLLLLSWHAPNTQQIMIRYKPAFETYHGEIKEWHGIWLQLQWRLNRKWGVVIGLLFILAVFSLIRPSEFLYFQF